jgi:neutral trehalase
MQDAPDLLQAAKTVLDNNDRGGYTQPAKGLYPHQWLWDSCFTAIGLRHLDTERAQTELLSLLRGQWHNGMLPNIIFRDDKQYRTDRNVWRSWLSPNAPDDVATTGITQPPMLAEAVVQVGAKMASPERRQWYRTMYQPLVDYHTWLYADRDPHGEGLTLQIHPWETGLDNTPPWMHELHEHKLSWWVRSIERLHLEPVVNLFRRDTKMVPSDQRFSAIEALALFDAQLRLRRKAYDIDRILDHGLFAIEDVVFNSIFIRANHHLQHIAANLKEELPAELKINMHKTDIALEELWDPFAGQYFSRDFVTHNLIKVPSIGTLLPLYSGVISPENAAHLVKMLENKHMFGTPFPIPSVPVDTPNFHRKLYWQGPSWINTNWLIIDGLERYGYKDHAAALRESTLEMVSRSGFHEYFDPMDGSPAGGSDFSWTAALVVDMLKH